jgi:hypothetical protein
MKRQLLLLVLVLTFGVCACSNDNDEPEALQTSIIGTWQREVSRVSSGNSEMVITQEFSFNNESVAVGRVTIYVNDIETSKKTFIYTYTYNGSTLTLVGESSTETFSVSFSDKTTMTLINSAGEVTIFNKKV